MRDVVGVQTPLQSRVSFRTHTATREVSSGDGLAGSAPTQAMRRPTLAAAPSGKGSFVTHVATAAILLAGALGVGLAASPAQALAATCPGAPTAVVQTADTTPQDPVTAWLNNVMTANNAIKQGNANAFLHVVSPQGLDVRGLDPQNDMQTQHFSVDDLTSDIAHHGAFYTKVFVHHDIGHGVMAPDDSGNVDSILLNN